MYIGSGAGFAFIGSFLTLAASVFLASLSFVTWPFRMLWSIIRDRTLALWDSAAAVDGRQAGFRRKLGC
jgi:hypothetical protein